MTELHVCLFPFLASGHFIPIMDMAKLFISRGLKASIITTPAFAKSLEGTEINLFGIKFPTEEVGLPEECQSLDKITTEDMHFKFGKALSLLQQSVEQILCENRPDFIVADTYFPWVTDVAAKFGIPRLFFHGTGCFAICAAENLQLYKPYMNVPTDSEPFVIPDLPHRVEFTRSRIPSHERDGAGDVVAKIMEQVRGSEQRSFGTLINSFYELESDFADYYRDVMGRRVWHIGPLLLSNREIREKARRGNKSAINEHECLQWLDTKKPNSVVYVCFGSMPNFSVKQLQEIAWGLDSSGQEFIWVVRKNGNEKWIPEGFEERIKGKGLIIRGWAPQMMILEHEAVGAFVTHCGWNSTMEAVCSGVPLITWPLYSEQFYNEKLLTEILKIGISVGHETWNCGEIEGVNREALRKAIQSIMMGEEAMEIRNRSRAFKEMARKAVEEGGSSYSNLTDLIQQITAFTPLSKQQEDS